MTRVIAGEDGKPDGLKFSAKRSAVKPDDLTVKVQIDQNGSGAELRGRNNEVVFRLDGRQLSELYSKNQLDVSRPERLKESIIRVYEGQRQDPHDPMEFLLDLKDIDPEQLIGRLETLVSWLREHVENDVFVDPHKNPPQLPQYPEIEPDAEPSSEIPEEPPSEGSKEPATEPSKEPEPPESSNPLE